MEYKLKKLSNLEKNSSLIIKNIQYLAKILTNFTLTAKFYSPILKISETSSVARKILRIFQTFLTLMRLFVFYKPTYITSSFSTRYNMLLTSKISNFIKFCFNFCDHTLLLSFFKPIPEQLKRRVLLARNLLWISDCIANILICCLKTLKLRKEIEYLVFFT